MDNLLSKAGWVVWGCILLNVLSPNEKNIFVFTPKFIISSLRRSLNISHQALKSFGFSGSPSHATSTGKSYGSKVTRNWVWGNPRGPSFQDRGPRDPKWVPWDQNFGLKNFLMPSSNDVILCVSEVCWSKNAENQQKHVFLGNFGHKIAKNRKNDLFLPIFCIFWSTKSQNS